MKVYKVVQTVGGKVYSCCKNSDFPQEARVEYKVGEYTKPNDVMKDSLLFAFKSLHEAKLFQDTFCSLDIKVYESDGVGVTKACYPQKIDYCYDLNFYIKYWLSFTQNRKLKKKLPKGQVQHFIHRYKTGVCCREIKLKKVV